MTLEGLIVEEMRRWEKQLEKMDYDKDNHEWWYHHGMANGLGIAIRLLRKWEDEQDDSKRL